MMRGGAMRNRAPRFYVTTPLHDASRRIHAASALPHDASRRIHAASALSHDASRRIHGIRRIFS